MARPRQARIKGTEPAQHLDIVEAAERYIEIRDERMELTEREIEANTALVAAMERHGLTDYVDEEAEIHVIIPATKAKAKVRRHKAPQADDE
jgi:hypothetical protein